MQLAFSLVVCRKATCAVLELDKPLYRPSFMYLQMCGIAVL